MAGSRQIVINELSRFTAKAVTTVTVEIVAELQETTPVDTGWARANWVPNIGVPEIVPVGTPDAVDSARTPAAVASVVASYKTPFQGKIFISNNVPYIGRLNNGHSKQAPRGFIQRSIRRALRAVSRASRS